MKTALPTSIVPPNKDTTMISKRRFSIKCVPPLLAVLGVSVGVGLGALASGAEFRSSGHSVDNGRATHVEVLPRVIVTPRVTGDSESAPPASEFCNRLHC